MGLFVLPGVCLAENGQKGKETVVTLDEVVVSAT